MFGLGLLGEKAEIIHACGAHLVHGLDHVAILGARIGADVDRFIEPVGELVLDLFVIWSRSISSRPRYVLAVAGDSQ